MRVIKLRRNRVLKVVMSIFILICLLYMLYEKSNRNQFINDNIVGNEMRPKLNLGTPGNFEPAPEPPRTGPGERGRPHKLRNDQENDAKAIHSEYGMNILCSDEISFNRTIPDLRLSECKHWNYPEDLQKTSVILVFHNEGFSVLMRTVHSVINRTPPQFLEEVLLVDDFSDKEDLKGKLEDYIKRFKGKVRLIRNREREGLIRTRSRGAKEARGEVIVFLDAHCEVNLNWLPPLLAPIYRDRTTMTVPIIDGINHQTFEINSVYQEGHNYRGIFEWGMLYKENELPAKEALTRKYNSEPYRSPTHAGGLFAIDRKYFLEIGAYDPGLLVWGGENFELSFKIWQCGGSIYWVPCSRVAHVYRGFMPYNFGKLAQNRKGSLIKINYKRVIETWFDDKYKEFFYTREPTVRYLDMGDISEQLKLKDRLNCKSFQWYMDNIAYDVYDKFPELPPNIHWGELRNVAAQVCLDNMGQAAPSVMGTSRCHGQGTNQLLRLNAKGQLGSGERCIDADSMGIKMVFCRDGTVNGPWQYDEKTRVLYHQLKKKCVAVHPQTHHVSLMSCDPVNTYQQWIFKEIRPMCFGDMHLHFERNTNTKCDCTILSLSWMGKVPDELPEDEGWKLNRTNYYQEGWLATGNVRGIVGVTYTTSHCNKSLDCPSRTNYNLRGHRSEVILVKWNEPYQKLASCDSSGVIFVWIKYEGRWSIELINDRNTRVTNFSWSHDGRMALICYQDGFVLVGSVAGQRYWSSMLNLDCTINCGIWTPDDQLVYFGTSNGQLVVMDVHGAMMAQVEIANQVAVISMAWSCEKFKMEETDESNDSCLCAKYVLAVCLENGTVLLMKHYYDVSPVHINTGLCPLCIEWSNSKQLLAVAGTVPHTEYTNIVKVYTDCGNLLYTAHIPYTLSAVTAMTWGHNDKRLFVATGCIVHMAWVSMRIASLQLLCSLQVYNRLQGGVHQIASLPLPLRIQHRLSKLFAHTIRCCVPEGSGLREFVSKTPKVRLHCTMLRHDEDISANCYTLFLEYLGGLVPLLKGKRTSKLKPEFVIFDPQIADCSCKYNSFNGNYSGSEREDSECEELCGSPRLTRRKNKNHNQILYADTLPEESHLAEVTSNIWGTKFRIHGIAEGLAPNLGQVTYKTSLLHLQPRQMTLLMAGDGSDSSASSGSSVNQVVSDDDDDNGKGGLDDGAAVAVAPLRARCRGTAGYQGNNDNGKSRTAEWFMTRSMLRDCECSTVQNGVNENGCGGLGGGVSSVGGVGSEEVTAARRGVVRSCSVGYLDLVEGGSNNRLVLVRQNKPVKLTHAGKSRSLDSSDMDKGIAGTGTNHIIHPPPSSSPASPALSKKKRNNGSSPIRARIMNSPLLPRRLRSRRTDSDGYQDLESFQKAQLRNKIEITAKRKEFIMHNKAPMWNENSQVYQLDFGGRVTQESAKNFQVEFRGKQVMQFGRIDGNAYTLDFQYPFSAVQAFAVALANVTQRLK